jgi:hypothetical protein
MSNREDFTTSLYIPTYFCICMNLSPTAVRPFNELVIVVVSTARGEITPNTNNSNPSFTVQRRVRRCFDRRVDEMMGLRLGIARVGWILIMSSYVIIERVESSVYALLVGLLCMVCVK